MIEFKLSTTRHGYTEVYCQKCFVFVGRGGFREIISTHLQKAHQLR